jgi:hypothetical protein
MWRKLCCRLFCGFVLIQVFSLHGGPPPALPQLNISLSGGQVTLSWQDTNNWLQCEGVLDPFFWVNVSTPPVVAGGTNTLMVPAEDPAKFFRLVNSPYLPPPTRLTLQPEENETVNDLFYLWWDEVPVAASYNLYFAAAPGVTKDNYSLMPQGTAILGITNLFTVVNNLVAGTRYYFVVTAVSSPGESADSNEASGVFGPHASIEGEIVTQLLFGTNTTQAALPGVSVTLSNLSNPTLVSQTITDPDGLFEFDAQPAGAYQLCWSARGFIAGCYSNVIILSNSPVDLGVILITPLSNATNGLVWGQVLLQDGSPAVLQDPFYQINLAMVPVSGCKFAVLLVGFGPIT